MFLHEIMKWQVTHPAKAVGARDVTELFKNAYGSVTTSKKGEEGFRVTGIWPSTQMYSVMLIMPHLWLLKVYGEKRIWTNAILYIIRASFSLQTMIRRVVMTPTKTYFQCPCPAYQLYSLTHLRRRARLFWHPIHLTSLLYLHTHSIRLSHSRLLFVHLPAQLTAI